MTLDVRNWSSSHRFNGDHPSWPVTPEAVACFSRLDALQVPNFTLSGAQAISVLIYATITFRGVDKSFGSGVIFLPMTDREIVMS